LGCRLKSVHVYEMQSQYKACRRWCNTWKDAPSIAEKEEAWQKKRLGEHGCQSLKSHSPPRLFPNWLYLSLSAFLFDRQGQRDWDVRSTIDVEPKQESGVEANKQDKASQHSSLPKQWSISLHLVATITSSVSSASVVCPFSLPAISLYPSYQTCVACWSFRLV
jgi:hypothetical protein